MRNDFLLIALTLLAALPGIASLPVIDRDEARYAQSTVQMIETGDYIDIRFQDEPRYKKPIGSYWAQAASIHLTGQADDIRRGERPIWAHRLPSVLGAVLAVLFTYRAGLHLLSRRAALIGAALLAVSVSLVFEAHQAKTDALLCAASACALYGWVSGRPWPFWLAIAAGTLLKGPVIVGVAGLAITAHWLFRTFLPLQGGGGRAPARSEGVRRGWRGLMRATAVAQALAPPPSRRVRAAPPPPWRGRKDTKFPENGSAIYPGPPTSANLADSADVGGPASSAGAMSVGNLLHPLLRPLPILTALLLTLPWFVAIHIHSNGAFLAEALGRDFGAKLGSAQETHGGPPGYYLLTPLLMFWPGTIALPLAVAFAWKRRALPALTPLFAWLLPMWFVLELVPTKLPHYTLPLYPALALLCGAAIASGWSRRTAIIGGISFLLVGLALAYAGVWAAMPTRSAQTLPVYPAFLAIILFNMSALAMFVQRRVRALRTAAPILAGALTSAIFFGILAHPFGTFSLSNTIIDTAQRIAPGTRLVSPDYREPSLAFLGGTDTAFSLDAFRSGDTLVLRPDTPRPACPDAISVEGSHYVKGVGRYWLDIIPTDACDASELDSWRATQAARATDSD